MNELDRFAQLAARARAEPAPAVDVRAAVLRALRQRVVPQPLSRPLLVFSGLSVVAAATVAVVAVQSWLVLFDPLAELLGPLTMVMK